MNMKISRRINSLCNLGIFGRTLAPILLPEIRKVVPAYAATFLWVDKNYKFLNVFDESPDSPLFINSYINDYLDNRDQEARYSLSKWLRGDSLIVTTEQLAYRKFYHSDYYHKILKPLGYHHSLFSGIKIGSDPVGILVLHRKLGGRKFSQRDKNQLRELSPLISHALQQEGTCFDVSPGEYEIGLFILDEKGYPQHISPQGRRLLFLAMHPEIKTGVLFPVNDRLLIPEEIVALVRNLCDGFDNKLFASRSLIWKKITLGGILCSRPIGFKGLIAVTAQYHVPTLYRVMLRCDELGLTGRQTEITTELFKGLSYDAVAEKLNVSTYTVTDHVKKIYEKLGIRNRSELLSGLISV